MLLRWLSTINKITVCSGQRCTEKPRNLLAREQREVTDLLLTVGFLLSFPNNDFALPDTGHQLGTGLNQPSRITLFKN